MLYSHRMEGFGCWCISRSLFRCRNPNYGLFALDVVSCAHRDLFVYPFFFNPLECFCSGGELDGAFVAMLMYCASRWQWANLLGSLLCFKLVCLNTSMRDESCMWPDMKINYSFIHSFIHSYSVVRVYTVGGDDMYFHMRNAAELHVPVFWLHV